MVFLVKLFISVVSSPNSPRLWLTTSRATECFFHFNTAHFEMLCSSGLQMKYRFVRYVNYLAGFFTDLPPSSSQFHWLLRNTESWFHVVIRSHACECVTTTQAVGERKNFKYKKVSLVCRWYVPSKHHVWSCRTNFKIFFPGNSSPSSVF